MAFLPRPLEPAKSFRIQVLIPRFSRDVCRRRHRPDTALAAVIAIIRQRLRLLVIAPAATIVIARVFITDLVLMDLVLAPVPSRISL